MVVAGKKSMPSAGINNAYAMPRMADLIAEPGVGALDDQISSFVHAAFALLEATTASMNAIPRMPSLIFG